MIVQDVRQENIEENDWRGELMSDRMLACVAIASAAGFAATTFLMLVMLCSFGSGLLEPYFLVLPLAFGMGGYLGWKYGLHALFGKAGRVAGIALIIVSVGFMLFILPELYRTRRRPVKRPFMDDKGSTWVMSNKDIEALKQRRN